jgi:hypothetical protein
VTPKGSLDRASCRAATTRLLLLRAVLANPGVLDYAIMEPGKTKHQEWPPGQPMRKKPICTRLGSKSPDHPFWGDV